MFKLNTQPIITRVDDKLSIKLQLQISRLVSHQQTLLHELLISYKIDGLFPKPTADVKGSSRKLKSSFFIKIGIAFFRVGFFWDGNFFLRRFQPDAEKFPSFLEFSSFSHKLQFFRSSLSFIQPLKKDNRLGLQDSWVGWLILRTRGF